MSYADQWAALERSPHRPRDGWKFTIALSVVAAVFAAIYIVTP